MISYDAESAQVGHIVSVKLPQEEYAATCVVTAVGEGFFTAHKIADRVVMPGDPIGDVGARFTDIYLLTQDDLDSGTKVELLSTDLRDMSGAPSTTGLVCVFDVVIQHSHDPVPPRVARVIQTGTLVQFETMDQDGIRARTHTYASGDLGGRGFDIAMMPSTIDDLVGWHLFGQQIRR